MRLICPNCEAQYEVEDGVIPDTGRDVQCSGCGHTWFQPGAHVPAAVTAEPDELPAPDEWEADDPESALAEEPEPDDLEVVPEPAGTLATSQEAPAQPANEPDDDAPEDGVGAVESDPARRTLDASLLSILREEAEREARARRAEGRSIETQTDLGLAEIPAALAARAAAMAAPTDDEIAPERGARLRPDPADVLPPAGPRHERLPDIEVINSTLRATSERGAAPASRDAPQTMARKRSGFRAGFLTVMLFAAIAAGLYAFAPTISTTLPALEPALQRYSASVDAGRVWLDVQMRAAIEKLQPAN